MSGTTFTLPNTLTVEDELFYDPKDKYGDPTSVVITVRFGEHTVAKYELKADHWPGEFYYPSATEPNRNLHYDTPEEFVAHKLIKLFKLIED